MESPVALSGSPGFRDGVPGFRNGAASRAFYFLAFETEPLLTFLLPPFEMEPPIAFSASALETESLPFLLPGVRNEPPHVSASRLPKWSASRAFCFLAFETELLLAHLHPDFENGAAALIFCFPAPGAASHVSASRF